MSKIYDGIMGLVGGGALGVPAEFKKRGTYKITDMTGYGTHNQPPGTWSDDSSMVFATMDSVIRKGKINLDDIMMNFSRWMNSGKFTPHGTVFDIGNSTAKAIRRFDNGKSISQCGCDGSDENGNGALMRILPIAFIFHKTRDKSVISDVASLTHSHYISNAACMIYCEIVKMLLDGEEKINIVNAISEARCYLPSEFHRLCTIDGLERYEIRSSGYVVDTLEAALWCFLHTETYADCVLEAINLGDDTDTVAAVAGGLAGIYYGCGGEGVREDWMKRIAKLDWIKTMCTQFAYTLDAM